MVTLPLLVHNTTEHGRKLVVLSGSLLLVIFSVKPALPARAVVGESGDGELAPRAGG